MLRQESHTCLLESDSLEYSSQEMEFQAEVSSSSSGYDSIDYSESDEEDNPAPRYTNTSPHHTATLSRRQSSSAASCGTMTFRNTDDLQDSLAFILDMPDMCDVIFLVGKKKVPVHGVKAILATRSRILYQLLLQQQRQQTAEVSKKKFKKHRPQSHPSKLTITVSDYKVKDFRDFLIFVHSGKVKVDVGNVIGLACAAQEYGIDDLSAACREFIHRCQDREERSTLLDLAWDYQHKRPAQKLICQLSTTTR